MKMTSDEVIRDLRDIDRLIAILGALESQDIDDLEDVCWLLAQRHALSGLLTTRRALRGKKVVSLSLWRYGWAASA
jgi:hypothetical protein